MMRVHHDAVMRTTVDLPEDLYRIVTSLAAHTRRSISQTASDLMRRGLEARAPHPKGASQGPAVRTHSTTGLPVLHGTRTITPEDVQALDDEA
jgi:negative regulator of replication initiation